MLHAPCFTEPLLGNPGPASACCAQWFRLHCRWNPDKPPLWGIRLQRFPAHSLQQDMARLTSPFVRWEHVGTPAFGWHVHMAPISSRCHKEETLLQKPRNVLLGEALKDFAHDWAPNFLGRETNRKDLRRFSRSVFWVDFRKVVSCFPKLLKW